MRTFSIVSRVLPVAALLVSAGCLQKEVTHTIYIAPSGVTWSALEKDVRSDHRDVAKRMTEEYDYGIAAGVGRLPIAAGLARLGGQAVTTSWVRRERPYTVLTDAHFVDLRQLAMAILADVGGRGDASLERSGCRTTFIARLDIESLDDAREDSAASALIEDLDRYRFVLTQGRFVSADGFTIGPDGAVAIPDPDKKPAGGVLVLSLTWADSGC